MNNTKAAAQTEIVEIIQEVDTETDDSWQFVDQKVDTKTDNSWQPVEGEAIEALKKQVMHPDSGIEEVEWEIIKTEAISVLSKCVPPTALPKQETGLVIGYVQSGKTLSFTTVAALARDNGYQMIIVIAGTSLNLLNQSTERLEKDLDLHTLSAERWYHFKSSELNEGDLSKLKDVLEEWQDPILDRWECQTVLITVMKHHQRLKNLADTLERLDLLKVPTLIIDDEGDQASLNTMAGNDEDEVSRTYQRLLSLRKCLPHHTFLQYTATPQAPLLINLIDVLSPNFAKVLSPGANYKGGKAFFQDAPNQICTIPDNEILVEDGQFKGPPESLLEAMQLFFLGVAAGRILGKVSRWSMMVHPSHKTVEHKRYCDWIEYIRYCWRDTLLKGDERDRQDLLGIFRKSYKKLQKTVQNLPPFEKLSSRLLSIIRKAKVYEFNSASKTSPYIPWHNSYVNILVGGQALDRGFTVVGLTVTYMPRGKGLGNADTLQQRARFFGYKEDVFEYCRVFLRDDVRDAYEHYIIHEEDVRQRLIEHDKTGKSLYEWKRTFFLDVNLKPCRDSVLDIGYTQEDLGDKWHGPKAPHHSIEAIEANCAIVETYLNKLRSRGDFQEDTGHPDRTEMQRHYEAYDLLKNVYEDLLVPFWVALFVDSEQLTWVRCQIADHLESNPNASCKVYHMSKGKLRDRSLNEKDQLRGLFQGRSEKGREIIYPGDTEIKVPRCVTVQIHNFRILREQKVVRSDVPVLTVWLPKDISQGLLVQNQGGAEIEY